MSNPGLIARLSRWFYRRKYGDITAAAERLATHPGIVQAVGQEKAREIAYRSYGSIIEDVVVGQWKDGPA